MRITNEILKNFNESAVELTDLNNNTRYGWFIIRKNDYLLLPFGTIWNTYSYKVSHIKSIKHLTNNFEVKGKGE